MRKRYTPQMAHPRSGGAAAFEVVCALGRCLAISRVGRVEHGGNPMCGPPLFAVFSGREKAPDLVDYQGVDFTSAPIKAEHSVIES
jgi:hypothetical protein